MSWPDPNLFAGTLRDRNGTSEFLILDSRPEITNKSAPGPLAYYVFETKGRFLRGGVFTLGHNGGALLGAEETAPAIVTVDVGWGSFDISPTHFHFALIDGDLVLQGSTDAKGQEFTAEGMQHLDRWQSARNSAERRYHIVAKAE
jgi:hypothetical protein